MEARAPAVVAVVVTTGQAPGLEATLSTLTGQDYEELSILVVANGGDSDVVNRVAVVAPNAFVKVLDENRGFAAACNEASIMVEGATFMVFCHDDVLLLEGAISQLVEASFRANAGIVTPKFVTYEDHFILLHVGQVADRFGTVRERVELGEIDHGQQDLERDVFVAPGGVTLIRTDLFQTLHGFDPLIPALGEDLDICWRAQVAGARVVVAPSAVVAHRQTLATGERQVTAVGTRRASRMDLQRRHQLATVLTCWSRHSLLGVVPALVALDVSEFALALLGRDTDRAGAIAGSWRWVWHNRKHLHQRRRALGAIRTLKDGDIVRLQVGGASRLKTFVATLFQEGLDGARGMLPELETNDDEQFVDRPAFAVAFSEDESFDDIAALDAPGRHQRLGQMLAGARSQLAFGAIVAVVWFYGVRNLVATPLPIIGRLAPLDSWWSTWRHFFASWSPNGTGTGTPAMPGYGFIAFAGTFVFGRMGILPRLVMIFAVPLGGWGIWRLLKSVVSNRARLVGAVAYVAFPLSANLIQAGRIDVLIVSAVLPFALRRILLLLNVEGFRPDDLAHGVAFGHRGWGRTRSGHVAVLLLQTAFMTAMVPAALVVVELVIVGLVLAQFLAPRRRARLDRPWSLAGHVIVGTALLLLPLVYDVFAAGTRAPRRLWIRRRRVDGARRLETAARRQRDVRVRPGRLAVARRGVGGVVARAWSAPRLRRQVWFHFGVDHHPRGVGGTQLARTVRARGQRAVGARGGRDGRLSRCYRGRHRERPRRVAIRLAPRLGRRGGGRARRRGVAPARPVGVRSVQPTNDGNARIAGIPRAADRWRVPRFVAGRTERAAGRGMVGGAGLGRGHDDELATGRLHAVRPARRRCGQRHPGGGQFGPAGPNGSAGSTARAGRHRGRRGDDFGGADAERLADGAGRSAPGEPAAVTATPERPRFRSPLARRHHICEFAVPRHPRATRWPNRAVDHEFESRQRARVAAGH
jgi:GT2 family glycosyltransferase